MARIAVPPVADMTEHQQRVYREIAAGRRGRTAGPLLLWITSPEFANRAQKLGEFVRYETSLSPRLSELSMLITARFWTAQYEWTAHKKEALKAGVDPAIIESIAHRQQPNFAKSDERAVYEFSKSLHETHLVPEPIYRELINQVGEVGAVELVGLLGYYTMISMTLNAFEIDVPEGFQPELQP